MVLIFWSFGEIYDLTRTRNKFKSVVVKVRKMIKNFLFKNSECSTGTIFRSLLIHFFDFFYINEVESGQGRIREEKHVRVKNVATILQMEKNLNLDSALKLVLNPLLDKTLA